MGIKKHEFKKVISSPIFIALTIIFLIYNFIVIGEKAYIRKDIKGLNKIVEEVGYKVDDEMMSNFNSYREEQLSLANDVIEKKTGESYESMEQFFDEGEYSNNEFSEEELEIIDWSSFVESYYNLVPAVSEQCEKFDLNKLIKVELTESSYSDNTKKILEKNWEEFKVRFDELKANGEHSNLFFFGKSYRMHSFLFKDVFRTMIYEIMILVMLVTAFLMNYEFENKTHLLAYSTKRGRRLIKDKFITSLGITVMITTIIVFVTLSAYFIVFDYSALWNVPVSNYFAQEYSMPFLSWFNLSIRQYLSLSIVVLYLLQLIFCGITFIISKFIRNTYIVAGVFAIIFGFGLLMPDFIPQSWDIAIASVYTPFTIAFNSCWWFMQKSGLITFKYYEAVTLSVWILGTAMLSILTIRSFKRESLN